MPDRRWVCGLMREHGDWDIVLEDQRYKEIVQPLFDMAGIGNWNCRDWPQNHPDAIAQPSGKCCWDD